MGAIYSNEMCEIIHLYNHVPCFLNFFLLKGFLIDSGKLNLALVKHSWMGNSFLGNGCVQQRECIFTKNDK